VVAQLTEIFGSDLAIEAEPADAAAAGSGNGSTDFARRTSAT
jgi:hypothetical protein